MAAHEFGILDTPPLPGQRFDAYEPERYGCIRVDDDCVGPLLSAFSALDTYAHTLDAPWKGLVYCGITLLPPSSLQGFQEILTQARDRRLTPLWLLAERALSEWKYLIHFGL